MNWTIEGGQVVGGDVTGVRDVHIVDGLLADDPAPDARRFDARGLTVAPGIIDLHGDGFERNLSPRTGVFFDHETALIETDRQLIANGITTAYLAMTISWEPGLRSLKMAQALVAALEVVRPRLIADIRLQFRWEIYALDAVEEVERWLALEPKPTLAFNDHFTPMFEKGSRMARDLKKLAARAGLDDEAYHALNERTRARAAEVPAAVARLAAAAQAANVICFAHDETTAEMRQQHRALGIAVSEFPLSRAAAAEAATHGEATVLGAPNVVRDGSHIGALDAEPASREGLCTALASDYYYPSLLAAAARLTKTGDMDADAVWALVSGNPADAVGLSDRGRIAAGRMADLVLFRPDAPGVEAVFRRGAPALMASPVRMKR
ncbi:MAG: alpha-D-ribose 1-methylphosphonate 5-triphosphate diphosphatase [Pseudomonadota bacterium]